MIKKYYFAQKVKLCEWEVKQTYPTSGLGQLNIFNNNYIVDVTRHYNLEKYTFQSKYKI